MSLPASAAPGRGGIEKDCPALDDDGAVMMVGSDDGAGFDQWPLFQNRVS